MSANVDVSRPLHEVFPSGTQDIRVSRREEFVASKLQHVSLEDSAEEKENRETQPVEEEESGDVRKQASRARSQSCGPQRGPVQRMKKGPVVGPCIYIGHIKAESAVEKEDIERLVKDFEPKEVLFYHKPKSKFAFVYFKTQAAAQKAVSELNGVPLMERPLVCTIVRDKSRARILEKNKVDSAPIKPSTSAPRSKSAASIARAVTLEKDSASVNTSSNKTFDLLSMKMSFPARPEGSVSVPMAHLQTALDATYRLESLLSGILDECHDCRHAGALVTSLQQMMTAMQESKPLPLMATHIPHKPQQKSKTHDGGRDWPGGSSTAAAESGNSTDSTRSAPAAERKAPALAGGRPSIAAIVERNASGSAMSNNSTKIRIKHSICKAWQKSECRVAVTDCRFAHGEEDLRGPNLFKTDLCTDFKMGSCPIPAERCQHAHGIGELRPPYRAPRPAAATQM